MPTATLSTLLFHTPLAGKPRPQVLFLASYPPRECGIATFTEDIRGAYDSLSGASSDVIAINDDPVKRYAYPESVRCQIERNDRQSYVRAAWFANEHPADVVNIQHEYGLFGGERGEFLLDFLAELRKPAIITLHTTLPNPDERLRFVTRELCNRSEGVVVLAYAGRRILEDDYGIDHRKVSVVLHGVPDVPLRRSHHFKRARGLQDKTVLATFGLLSRGKGIQYVIEALPTIFAQHPSGHYVLLGETHPEVRKHEGESYRDELWQRVVELGLADRVTFDDRYLNDEEVVAALEATDLYISPSLDPNQIVSGTLSYAVACGRVVVATESVYARELLGDGRGITVPFKDSKSIAGAVNLVLSDADLRSSIETAAYRYGRSMTWPKVARQYEEIFVDAIAQPTAVRRSRALDSSAAKLWTEALHRHASGLSQSVGDAGSRAK